MALKTATVVGVALAIFTIGAATPAFAVPRSGRSDADRFERGQDGDRAFPRFREDRSIVFARGGRAAVTLRGLVETTERRTDGLFERVR
ncbi:hypothetical protein GCM10023196_086990 [Actinoallomurus vinaceus]|uniref:Uncharacterized protein n=1 Tax=Actinoallomurus vinaceus TaxID=1080074 RepID=A0ABP8UQ62_9ACTN